MLFIFIAVVVVGVSMAFISAASERPVRRNHDVPDLLTFQPVSAHPGRMLVNAAFNAVGQAINDHNAAVADAYFHPWLANVRYALETRGVATYPVGANEQQMAQRSVFEGWFAWCDGGTALTIHPARLAAAAIAAATPVDIVAATPVDTVACARCRQYVERATTYITDRGTLCYRCGR